MFLLSNLYLFEQDALALSNSHGLLQVEHKWRRRNLKSPIEDLYEEESKEYEITVDYICVAKWQLILPI